MNSKALTKMQSIILTFVIIFAVVSGAIIAKDFLDKNISSETIKIGLLVDLDGVIGNHVLQGTLLAAEEINENGGILGRQVEVIAEDRGDGRDLLFVTSALNRLIGIDKVDFIIIHNPSGDIGFSCQDIIAEHKKITIAVSGNSDLFTQRVLDNYEKFKYFFKVQFNSSSIVTGITDSLLLCREITGFNKVGILSTDVSWARTVTEGLNNYLSENGFDIVYQRSIPQELFDFSSYFAAAETAETEIIIPLISGDQTIPFAKEYHDRQSPLLIYDGVIGEVGTLSGWNITGGKCNYISVSMAPIISGYPYTNKTLSVRTAFIERWDSEIHDTGVRAYDALRFILSDAIERAGTIETEAVIKALETTKVETSQARNFIFTSSHDVMMGEDPNNPNADYSLMMVFQWQNGELAPIYPKQIMEEAGSNLIYPPWSGPWDKIN
ncbi:MAG: ABC transporter substrate-binding protein [Candidatus Bathyarchaeota archaeon]